MLVGGADNGDEYGGKKVDEEAKVVLSPREKPSTRAILTMAFDVFSSGKFLETPTHDRERDIGDRYHDQ